MSPSPFEEKRLGMVALIAVANVSNKIAAFGTQQDLEESGFVLLPCKTTLNFTQIQTALNGYTNLLRSFHLDVSYLRKQMNTD